MIKAHKIRLHPTPEQATYFAKAAGTARYTFNWAVAEWKQQYEAGEKPSALGLRTQFHALRKEQLPWTYDVTKCAIKGAFMDVAAAFTDLGRKKTSMIRWRAWEHQRKPIGEKNDENERGN